MVFTFNSSTSAPSLCSALAIADSSTFLMMCAPFFGLKARRLSAFSTGSPRIWSATSRPFWADSRTPWSVARVSMGLLLLLAARSRGGSRRGGRRRGSRRSRSSGGSVRSAGPRRCCGFQKLLVGHSVALEDARQRELPELVPHHIFRDVHRDVLFAVVDRDGQPDEIRQNRGAPRPGLDRALVACRARRADLPHQMVVHEGTLLNRASHGLALVSFLVPELDDHAACALVLAGLVALGQHPPGAYGILPCRGLSFAAAMRVVDRIHRDAAHGGPHAAPADASGLADRFQAVLLVADLADRRAAVDVHLAYLPRTQPDLCVAAFAC